jgi:[NiFe] hydrogenase diaphorase moiety small subunit
MAYRLGIRAPEYEYFFRERDVDATHPDVFIDHNRCIRCARCVRTSRDVDGKHVFQFVGRGTHKRIAVNSAAGLGGTDVAAADEAVEACPTGALMRKRVGYAVPIGKRLYDHEPIGSDIAARGAAKAEG